MIQRALDLGGSKTRIAQNKKEVRVFDSGLLEVDPQLTAKDFIEDKYSDFVIEKAPMAKLVGRRFCKGEAALYYKGKTLSMDNQDTKTEQEIVYINGIFAIARTIADNFRLNEEVQIAACIPTSEFYSEQKNYADIFKANLTGDFTVYFPLLNRRINFNATKNNIAVLPEGVVAAYRFSRTKQFVHAITIIIDVGYRSTDITILKEFKPIGRSAVSRPKGGINIEAVVLSTLERDGIFLSREEVANALGSVNLIRDNMLINIIDDINTAQTLNKDNWEDACVKALATKGIITTVAEIKEARSKCYITQGESIKDITSYVVSAKKNFAASLKADIVDVLATEMMSINSLNNILPIGRPFDGDISSETNLANILIKELGSNLTCYQVPNLGLANIEGIAEVFFKDEATL